MQNLNAQNRKFYTIITLYMLAFSFSIMFGVLSGLAFFLLSIWSILNLATNKPGLATTNQIRRLLLISVPIGLSSILSFSFGDSSQATWRTLAVQISFSLILPIWYLLQSHKVTGKLIWISFAIAPTLGLIVGLYEVAYLKLERADGSTVATFFGQLSVLFSFLSLSVLLFLPGLKKGEKYLLIFGVVAGAVSAILSGSRGSWLALPILILIIIWSKRESLSLKKLMLIVGLFIVFSTVVYKIPQTGVQARIEKARTEFSKYQSGVSEHMSVGLRLEYWRQSVPIVKQHWLTGIGPGYFGQYILNKIEAGEAPGYIYLGDNTHPHNGIAYVLTERGVVGLLAEILLFGVPLLIFFREFKAGRSYSNTAALSGIIVIVGMGIFSITSVMTAWPLTAIFYILCIAFFLHCVDREKECANPS